MKKMKWILIIAAVIIAFGSIRLIVKRNTSDFGRVLDGDGMINPRAISMFSYYRGGGMKNGHYRVTLEGDELTVERRAGQKTDVEQYTVPSDTINKIEDILFDSGVKEWQGEFPESEVIALDADTIAVIIDYADGAHIEFDSNQEVPEAGWEAVNEAMRLLEALPPPGASEANIPKANTVI